MTRPPLGQLEALLGQMRRDLPNTDTCLPNLAGDTLRAKAAVIQEYINVLEPAVSVLRAQADAVLRVEQAARELMERSEQPEHTCNWSYGRGAREALKDIHGALAQAEASQDTTDYDNAVTETVCDRLLEVIAGQGEPSFGGPRLNMIVRLIRDLRAQAGAGAGEIEALRVIPAADLRPGDRVLIDHGVVTLSCVTHPAIGGEAFVRAVFTPANRYGDTSLDLIPTARYAVVGRPMREVQAAWDALTADQKRAALAQANAGGEG